MADELDSNAAQLKATNTVWGGRIFSRGLEGVIRRKVRNCCRPSGQRKGYERVRLH